MNRKIAGVGHLLGLGEVERVLRLGGGVDPLGLAHRGIGWVGLPEVDLFGDLLSVERREQGLAYLQVAEDGGFGVLVESRFWI